ncbi:MAG: outer membrane beta-barrel protein [Deinococcales bacterium]|nr:outer membrane beta-barrel protein [Chitinophagaceae bacterium]
MNAEQFDNELHHLSKKASNDSPEPFNEAAWQRMEQLLDADQKKRRFVIWWWLAPILLVGGALLFYFNIDTIIADKNESNINITNKLLNPQTQLSEQKKNNSKANISEADNKKHANTTPNSVNSTEIPGKKDDQKVVKIVTNNSNKIAAKNKLLALTLNKTTSNTSNTNTIKAIEPTINKEKNISQSQEIRSKQTITANTVAITNDTNTTIKSAEIQISIVADKPKISNDSLTQIATFTPKDTTTKVKVVANTTTKKSVLSRLTFSAFVTSDLTTVKFKNIDKVSTSFGVGITYDISKKLSISTGFAIAKKLYKADSADYASIPLWSNPMYKLRNITANCLVYEVPVNLQYQFKQSGKNSWLAVVGLSTYYMKSESYDYNYSNYGQTIKTTYLVENKNNHLLAVLNLGVGYRRQFSNKFSYQLTPYLKMPLTGIGAGKVNLYSAGLQVSINLKGR